MRTSPISIQGEGTGVSVEFPSHLCDGLSFKIKGTGFSRNDFRLKSRYPKIKLYPRAKAPWKLNLTPLRVALMVPNILVISSHNHPHPRQK